MTIRDATNFSTNDTILILLFYMEREPVSELVEKRNRYPSNIVAIVPSYIMGVGVSSLRHCIVRPSSDARPPRSFSLLTGRRV